MAAPPGSAAALADQIGSTYQVALANGLSTRSPPDELPLDELELELELELDEFEPELELDELELELELELDEPPFSMP